MYLFIAFYKFSVTVYVTILPADENICIKNIQCKSDDNGQVAIQWEWPNLNTDINIVYLYPTTYDLENATLEQLINENATYVPFTRREYNINGCYKKYIKDDVEKFKIFPVKNIKNSSETFIYEQQKGNETPFLYKQMIINYSIKYKSMGLGSKFKRAYLSFSEDSISRLTKLRPNALRLSKKLTNSQMFFEYPLDIKLIHSGDYFIILKKDEELKLCIGFEFDENYKRSVIINMC